MTVLQTERLTLRPLVAADAGLYAGRRYHPEVAKWLSPAADGVDPLDSARAAIERFEQSWRDRRYAPWGLFRDGALIAWVVPEDAGPTTGFNILGAHTDSPSFKLKPKPTTGAFGWLQAGVEVYGGPLLNSWLDRELQLAGRLVMLDGTEHLTATGPMLRFPQLAIHLDRAVNDGRTLDKQRHMTPVWGLGNPAAADLLAGWASTAAGGPSLDPCRTRRSL